MSTGWIKGSSYFASLNHFSPNQGSIYFSIYSFLGPNLRLRFWTYGFHNCYMIPICLNPSTLTALLRFIIYSIYVYIITKSINAVLNDGLSIWHAQIECSVPWSTLVNRINGRVLCGAISGKSKYLSNEEKLVHFFYSTV